MSRNVREKIDMIELEPLEPCPFFGDPYPVLIEDKNQYKIYCDNPDCDCQYGWYADREYIIKGWNRRVYDSK